MQRRIHRRAGERTLWLRMGVALFLGAGLGGSAVWVGGAQQTPTQPVYSQPGYNRPSRDADPLDPMRPFGGSPNPLKLEHMREDERHKRLTADTARLVELSNQLKTEVDKASKDELSLDVVRKAAEIEKLAHDVKERMKS